MSEEATRIVLTGSSVDSNPEEILRKVFEYKTLLKDAHATIAQEVWGMDDTISHMMSCMIAGGSALAEGNPGLAKTLLISLLAGAMGLDSRRIQCTPDTLPSDITGSEIARNGEMRFLQGPVFTNLLHVDEINRTSSRVQSGLLEAMQEKQVSVGGVTHTLERPFFVFATQNPIESEGTNELPEAQLDRFLMKIPFTFPDPKTLARIVVGTTGPVREGPSISAVFNKEAFLDMQKTARQITLTQNFVDAVVRVVTAAQPGEHADEIINKEVRFGPSPRAAQAFALIAKARALMRGETTTKVEDIEAIAPLVLTHRMGFVWRGVDKEEGQKKAVLEALVRKI